MTTIDSINERRNKRHENRDLSSKINLLLPETTVTKHATKNIKPKYT